MAGPYPWDSTESWKATEFSDIEIQVVGVPSTPYQVQKSLDGVNWRNCSVYDETDAKVSTITAEGFFYPPGNCYLKFSAGAGSTITRRAAT
jgi:hypothetical protein